MEREHGKLDVLIVEDDRNIGEAMAQLLEHTACRVRTAANGNGALAQLASGFVPNVILLDLYMPVMNGWSFRAVQLQHADLADIPVVIVSGTDRLHEIAPTLRAVATYPKPIVVPVLLNTFPRTSNP